MKHSTLKSMLRMMLPVFFCGLYSANAQLAFTNANSTLQLGGNYSGCAVTVSDVNFDGMDDILRMDADICWICNYRTVTEVIRVIFYDIGSSSAWAMTCADVDLNGWKDAIMDGDGELYL